MRWEIEPTGCCERKGMRQIRICFYLEPGDARYNEHHVNMPVIPKEGYKGKKDRAGAARSDKDYQSWLGKLPKKWQTNPFHNHFIRVPLNASFEEISVEADKLLPHFYGQWKRGQRLGVSCGGN